MDKDALRELVWDALQAEGVAAFPFPPHGRIPNFKGSADAARTLAGTDAWGSAGVVKCNPDAPQRHVRRLALEAGKTVVMAVPRLTQERCFWLLDPERVDAKEASTIKGASRLGQAVVPEDVPEVDLVVLGSVAVDRSGGRLGKGGGYADLEYALLEEAGRLASGAQVVSTVHPLQVQDDAVPMTDHDVPLDGFTTPDGFVATPGDLGRLVGIDWDLLDEQDLEAMPPLAALRALRGG